MTEEKHVEKLLVMLDADGLLAMCVLEGDWPVAMCVLDSDWLMATMLVGGDWLVAIWAADADWLMMSAVIGRVNPRRDCVVVVAGIKFQNYEILSELYYLNDVIELLDKFLQDCELRHVNHTK